MKRVTIDSAQELINWLVRNEGLAGPVMPVPHADRASSKHVSRAEIQAVLQDHGWVSGQRYTLSKALLGPVVQR